MSIKSKLTLLLTACVAVPLGLGVGLSIHNARSALRQARVAALEAVAELKVTRIRDFFQERREDMRQLSRAPEVRAVLERAFGRSREALDAHLAGLDGNSRYADFMVATPEGRTAYCGHVRYEACRPGAPVPLDAKSLAAARQGFWNSDMDWEPGAGGPAPHMILAAPVPGTQGRAAGVVLASLDMEPIFSLIGDNTGLGVSGETVVGRRSAGGIMLLSPTRHDPKALLKTFSRRETRGTRAFPVQLAASGRPGSGTATDYRGRRVLAAWRHIPELDWGVVAKMDEAEAFAPLRRIIWMSLLLASLLLGLGALAAACAAETVVRPLRKLQEAAEAVGRGDIYCAVAPRDGDELGELSRAFNGMATDLKNAAAQREAVEEALRESGAQLSRALIEIQAHNADLRRARAEWERTFNAVPDLIAVLDADHRIRRVNKAMAERLGLAPEGCVGRPCHELIHDGTHKPGICPHSFTCMDGQEHFVELAERRLGGEFLISTTPVLGPDGKVVGSVHVARDITVQKRHEAELREAARLRADLISLINHEYANGLTNMKLALTLLRGTEAGGEDETRRHAFEVLERAVEKLKGYTTNFLDLHRIESGKFEFSLQPISARAVVLDDLVTLRPLAEAKKQRLALQSGFPEDAPVAVRADPDCLSLIVNNLVTNAVKYTPEGGAITIRLSLEGSPAAEAVRFSVEDTGIGMSEEDQRLVLEGFHRTEESKLLAKGFGVGLMLVRQLLEKHGSRLEVESRPGQGSRFSFRLPVWTDAAAPQPPSRMIS